MTCFLFFDLLLSYVGRIANHDIESSELLWGRERTSIRGQEAGVAVLIVGIPSCKQPGRRIGHSDVLKFFGKLARISASFSLYACFASGVRALKWSCRTCAKPFTQSFHLFGANKELVLLHLLDRDKSVCRDDARLQVGQWTDASFPISGRPRREMKNRNLAIWQAIG